MKQTILDAVALGTVTAVILGVCLFVGSVFLFDPVGRQALLVMVSCLVLIAVLAWAIERVVDWSIRRRARHRRYEW